MNVHNVWLKTMRKLTYFYKPTEIYLIFNMYKHLKNKIFSMISTDFLNFHSDQIIHMKNHSFRDLGSQIGKCKEIILSA